MASYNTGRHVGEEEIKDYEKAAKDFAEGNTDLEYLLLNCFCNGIKTYACCGDGKENPYISFLYTDENLPYLYAILSSLKDRGYNFYYMLSKNNLSTFVIQENDQYDKSNLSTMFQEIDEVIRYFDSSRDYYYDLPLDLQLYINIINTAQNNPILNEELNRDELHILGEGIRFHYEKNENGYQYVLFTRDESYKQFAEIASFKREDVDWCYCYNLEVSKREDAIPHLCEIARESKKFVDSYSVNEEHKR